MLRVLSVLAIALLFSDGSFAEQDRIPDDERTLREETGLGHYQDAQIISGSVLLLDEELNRRVNEIGQRVAAQAGRPDLEYKFRIVISPEVNAYATSAGFVYVNTGLLGLASSPDELAAILAHEIVHNSESHMVTHLHSAHRKRVAGQVIGTAVGTAAGVGLAVAVGSAEFVDDFIELGMNVGQATGEVISEISIAGYAAKQELDADDRAVDYLVQAEYDPYAFIRILKKIDAERDSQDYVDRPYASALINKQPGLEERLSELLDELPPVSANQESE
jgi:predicted Zn-dependent protease